MATEGIDISNWQGEITPDIARCFAQSVDIVVVRASLESMTLVGRAQRQIAACQAAGLEVHAYVWMYPSWDPVKTIRDATREYGSFDIRWWWVDAEEVQDKADPARNAYCLRTMLDELRAAGRQSGVYTGAWWWNDPQYMDGSTNFATDPLWVAFYDGQPGLNFVPFGGWTRCHGKQWSGTSSLCGISPIDRDTFDETLLAKPNPEPAPCPPLDKEWELRCGLAYAGSFITRESLTRETVPDWGTIRAEAGHVIDAINAAGVQ
jgi:GH25 family lysozyme M1 (1,4-beta-N-acetylmuramidase)